MSKFTKVALLASAGVIATTSPALAETYVAPRVATESSVPPFFINPPLGISALYPDVRDGSVIGRGECSGIAPVAIYDCGKLAISETCSAIEEYKQDGNGSPVKVLLTPTVYRAKAEIGSASLQQEARDAMTFGRLMIPSLRRHCLSTLLGVKIEVNQSPNSTVFLNSQSSFHVRQTAKGMRVIENGKRLNANQILKRHDNGNLQTIPEEIIDSAEKRASGVRVNFSLSKRP